MPVSPQILFTVFVLLHLAASSVISAEPDELAVGISGNGVTVLSLWMAQTAGFYKREGLKIDIINMEGSTRGIQVLLSRKIDIMHAGLGPVFQANRQGADLRIVAATSNRIPFTFFGSRDLKTAEDLKGGTVAVGTFGSEGDIAATLALKRLGINRKDVIVVQVGEFSKRFAALLSGQVKATALVEPASTIARDRGLIALVDLAAANIPWVFTGVTVHRSFLKDRQELLTRFVRAEIEGAYFGFADAQHTKEVIAQKFRTSEARAIDATYNDFKKITQLDFEPSVAGAKNVLALLNIVGVQVDNRNLEDHIDRQIIDNLIREGFFASMRRKYNVQ